jgi:hypothetical protein
VDLVDALLEAPIGVALLDRIAAGAAMHRGHLLIDVLDASLDVGPWRPGAPDTLADAYEHASRHAELALPLAAALLVPPIGVHQELWLSAHQPEPPHDRKLANLDLVYGNGEFTWSGIWTVTEPPAAIHDGLVDVWEHYFTPTSRWRLPVRDDARIWQIDHPADWVRLVEAYPKRATRPHAEWELPGPNQHVGELRRLLAQPDQRGARAEISGHVLPDWTAVQRDWDGVHLSWAGFVTTEGFVADLADGAVTMLRYWASERTLWLSDVFGEPEPLDAPALTGAVGGDLGISALHDEQRRGRDRRLIDGYRGR